MKLDRIRTFVTAAAVGLLVAAPTQAQEYPTRTINLMVGFPAAGPIDVAARQVQPFLEKYLGGKIAVINKPGAAGALMNQELANAAPDGYTLGLLSSPGLFTVLFGSNLTYTADSFDYVGTIANEPYVIFVHPDSPYKNLKAMVDRLKKEPRSINITAAGSGSAPHLGLLVLEQLAGVKFNYIPVQGAAQMVASVLGKHTDGGVTTVSGALPLMSEGQVHVSGVMAAERVSSAPNVLTFAEQGAAVEWGSLRGIGGPKGLPANAKKKLYDAIQKMHADPDFKAQTTRDKQLVYNITSEKYAEAARAQYAMLAKMWKENPWK